MPHSVLQHMPRQILGTFISCVFKFERADLAVTCCAKGDDSGFGIFAFPREKTSITKTSDKWDTACVLTAPVGSSPAKYSSACCSQAQQSSAAQKLPGFGCAERCAGTQPAEPAALASGSRCRGAAVARAWETWWETWLSGEMVEEMHSNRPKRILISSSCT